MQQRPHKHFPLLLAVLLLLLFNLYSPTPSFAYEIKGKLNLSADWQQQLFLSTINKLDDYYSANPEDIIKVGHIDEEGNFSISGSNLPLEQRFYRLYIVKKEDTEFDACLYMDGDDHNFVHLAMNNNTVLEIKADASEDAPFGNYDVVGDEANIMLRNLSRLIYPSFYFHKIKFPSELQFTREKLNRDLFHFADSCQHTLVALAAIMNTDMDKYHQLEAAGYATLGERLKTDLHGHDYTQDYFRKLQYHKGDPMDASLPAWLYLVLGLLSCSLFIAIAVILSQRKKIVELTETSPQKETVFDPKFTPQEEKILSLIVEGKTNKQIAATLFIELSTVKTHINKLYAKIGAKNRAEAKMKAKSLF